MFDKYMKILPLILMLFLSVPAIAAQSRAAKVILATSSEERAISEAYDVYLSAISHKTIAKARLDFPISLVKESSTHFILERAYYISPNELRGFGLAIPKALAKKEHGRIKAIQDVVMQKEERRQGLHTVAFAKKRLDR